MDDAVENDLVQEHVVCIRTQERGFYLAFSGEMLRLPPSCTHYIMKTYERTIVEVK